MNILFLTLLQFNSFDERNIYTDLLREFIKSGHNVYAISPVEKREHIKTHYVSEGNSKILRVRIGNTQKTNIVEKGFSTVMIEPIFKNAIKNYMLDVRFDLILYSTPPITFCGAIEYVKKRDNAKTYLLLKDIFPQNAVDLGMMTTKGIKGLMYKHFRNQEKKLYRISDTIGCMSEANVRYVLEHNPEIESEKVEVCPNSIEVVDKSVDEKTRITIRKKYGLPIDKKIFVYGGNLGKPQGIPFIIKCLNKCRKINDVFFLIVGNGTEYYLLDYYVKKYKQRNLKLMKNLPKEDFDTLVGACDVGLIFLDHRFTIPNFPSRLLSYMQAKLPVLACTDPNTDIGEVIVDGGFGWWCESDDAEKFEKLVTHILLIDMVGLGDSAFNYFELNYNSQLVYRIIMESL